jgi:hypothetical protein
MTCAQKRVKFQKDLSPKVTRPLPVKTGGSSVVFGHFDCRGDSINNHVIFVPMQLPHGMLVCWYVGMLVCWYVGMLVCGYVGMWVCGYVVARGQHISQMVFMVNVLNVDKNLDH